MGFRVGGGISVPTQGACAGKLLDQCLFDVLRPRAKKFDTVGATLRTNFWFWYLKTALMAVQCSTVAVISQRGIAARAGRHITTIPAKNIGGCATPVKEQNRLLTTIEGV